MSGYGERTLADLGTVGVVLLACSSWIWLYWRLAIIGHWLSLQAMYLKLLCSPDFVTLLLQHFW